MARAFLSDSYGRWSHLCAFVPPQGFPCLENDKALAVDTADRAMSEARAILAETSPETRYSSTFAPVSYYPPWSGRSMRGEMHAALAESLRAFVEA